MAKGSVWYRGIDIEMEPITEGWRWSFEITPVLYTFDAPTRSEALSEAFECIDELLERTPLLN